MKRITKQEILDACQNIPIERELVCHAGNGGYIKLSIELTIVNGRSTTPIFSVYKNGVKKEFGNLNDATNYFIENDFD